MAQLRILFERKNKPNKNASIGSRSNGPTRVSLLLLLPPGDSLLAGFAKQVSLSLMVPYMRSPTTIASRQEKFSQPPVCPKSINRQQFPHFLVIHFSTLTDTPRNTHHVTAHTHTHTFTDTSSIPTMNFESQSIVKEEGTQRQTQPHTTLLHRELLDALTAQQYIRHQTPAPYNRIVEQVNNIASVESKWEHSSDVLESLPLCSSSLHLLHLDITVDTQMQE